LREQQLLLQIAFDFYDAANDDVISELDLFKVFQQFSSGGRGTKELFQRFLKQDITTITRLFNHLKSQQ
jgi:hypothetical protein